ncbi:acetyl-CoA C-acetyltransferase [Nakamurella sp. UYEF19]|uniref:acetyl-CoA C-acetyltransferase n=1 Tax=Nakamurella sp. UYEF19 TaxID=1756392 RepID=UPI00339872E0
MPEAVIVAATRSPIGRAFKGSLKGMRPDDMAVQIVRAALDQVPELDPNTIDDLLLGCGSPGGEQGFNMARVVAVALGLDTVPGATITRYCSSSVQTTRMAMHAIRAGEGHVFVSAGVEAVSRAVYGTADSPPYDPMADPKARNPWTNKTYADAQGRSAARSAGGADTWHDPREDGDVPDIYIAMGQTAENVAGLRSVSRVEQDEFACRSQNLAEAAGAEGFWKREITPLTLPDGSVVETDDCPRAGTTLEALSGLKPVFRPDGTITAGNACPLNDGAAALVIMSDTRAAELGITPLARVIATGVSGLSPEIMGLGPVQASRKALALAGMTIDDIDLVEINEAFAAQVIPSYQELGIDLDRLNVNGGSIAVGHPFGMTGARITNTLLNGLRSRDKSIGLETMCVGGGQGMAVIFERLN